MMDELQRSFGGTAAAPPRPTNSQDRTSASPDAGQDAPELFFECADDWLQEWLFAAWLPPVRDPSFKWCTKWWLHPEAVHRIECLWRAWEHCRLDGLTGTSAWWRDHFDYHWAILTGPRGPFSQCADRHQEKATPLSAIRTPVIMNDYVSDY